MRVPFIFALFASALFLGACNQPATETTAEPEKVVVKDITAVNTGELKFAYVNTDSLSNQYELIDDLEEEMVQGRLEKENELQQMVQAFERDYTAAQREAASLSQEALAILQRKLAEKEQEIMMRKQALENELMADQQKITQDYLDKVHDFLEEYAQENGYDIIYGYNGLNNLLYINKGYDITDQVVDALNEAYAQTKATADNTEAAE